MKKLLILLLFPYFSFAQLYGKGKILTREFDYKNFERLRIEDFDGQIEIEIGKPYAIKVSIDENLEPRLQVIKNDQDESLTIHLQGNYNGKLYLEDTHIKIHVSMPYASEIKHRGNTNVSVNGIHGRLFMFENNGNGNVNLEGEVDELLISKNGNGNVNAQNAPSKTAKVKSYGNGNVTVNSQISLTAHGSGNGSVMQKGHGKIETLSGIIGNGNVRKI